MTRTCLAPVVFPVTLNVHLDRRTRITCLQFPNLKYDVCSVLRML